jgi:hypothetical protein
MGRLGLPYGAKWAEEVARLDGGMEQIKCVPKPDIFHAVLLADVECGTEFLHLVLRAERPQTPGTRCCGGTDKRE